MSPRIIESQVDWLTCTSPSADDTEGLAQVGQILVADEATNGNRVWDWRWMGYQGWHAGRASVGTGIQGTILRLSGDLAQAAFGPATGACDHVARLDIAATVRLDGQDWGYEARRWEEYKKWASITGGDHAGRYFEDLRGSATAYIGSRTSEVMLRIYNKEGEVKANGDQAERERYRNCHRYELEFKNARACAMAAALGITETPSPSILGWVAGFLTARGISADDVTLERLDLEPGFRRRSDTDSKLGWLASQVQPTMRWLADHGHTEDLIRVLGLDHMDDGTSSQKVGPRLGK